MQPKISVIVPVYNTEKYVERCLLSLLEQSLRDIELIIINDGSTDDSLKIIKNVLGKHPNHLEKIILISRENKGVAETRDEGVALASGEYTIHCDSDDYCDRDMLLKMYEKAKKGDLDILVSDFALDYGHYIILKSHKEIQGKDCISLLLRGDLDVSLSNKLIKRTLYIENDVKVLKGLNMGEDFCTTLRLFFYAKKIDYLQFVSFYYNKYNNSSATSNYTEKSLNDIVNVVFYLENFLKEKNIYNKYARDFLEYKIIVKNLHLWNGLEKQDVFNKGIKLFPDVGNLVLLKTKKVSWFLKFILIFGKKIETRNLFLLKEKIRIFIISKKQITNFVKK